MKTAIISDCKTYRYVLTRKIDQSIRWVKPCLFIMLNPSIADAEIDDPTIRRCIGFAKSWGCTSLTVVNLFAYRATDPKELLINKDIVGPKNNEYILEQVKNHSLGIIVAAWGSHPVSKLREDFIKSLDVEIKCLGKTKNGSPKHPLYIAKDKELELWK